jgi:acetyl esterase
MPTRIEDLDPVIAQVLEMGKGQPALETLSVADARANMLMRVELLKPFAPQGVETEDLSVATGAGPLPIRIYRPAGAAGPLTVVVWLHGGGWVLGNIETHDNVCRFLAEFGPLLVVSVDYRLAPEAKAPAQVQDTLAALDWAAAHAAAHGGDPARLVVGGDSAGGNLAALAALATRGRGPKLAGQLLVYPVTDYPADAHASYAENADFGLTRDGMEWFWAHWLADGAGPDATTAPLRVPDLSGLPPAYVVTSSHDVLRDEGKAYAGRLAEAGVLDSLDHVEGTIHGFFSMGGLAPVATETLKRAAVWAANVKAVA